MNGPRTNQFVAPTSFITSISRRRAKIESRMVLAIRRVDAVTSRTTATRNAIRDHLRDREDAIRGLRPPAHVVHPRVVRLLDLGAERRRHLALDRRDDPRVRQRVRRQRRLVQIRELRLHLLLRCLLRDEDNALDASVILADLGADERLLPVGGAGGEVDLHLEALLHVVAPREHPRAEGDEEAEQEHADQHGHRCRERRRQVRRDRRPCFGEEQADLLIRSVASAPLVAGELALFERDHALAHLVDHLAIVRDHEIVVPARLIR